MSWDNHQGSLFAWNFLPWPFLTSSHTVHFDDETEDGFLFLSRFHFLDKIFLKILESFKLENDEKERETLLQLFCVFSRNWRHYSPCALSPPLFLPPSLSHLLFSLSFILIKVSSSNSRKSLLPKMDQFWELRDWVDDSDRRLAVMLFGRPHEFVTVCPPPSSADVSFQFSDGRRAQGHANDVSRDPRSLPAFSPTDWLRITRNEERTGKMEHERDKKESVCLLVRGNTDSTWRHSRCKSDVPILLVLYLHHCTSAAVRHSALCAFAISLIRSSLQVYSEQYHGCLLSRRNTISKMFASAVLCLWETTLPFWRHWPCHW